LNNHLNHALELKKIRSRLVVAEAERDGIKLALRSWNQALEDFVRMSFGGTDAKVRFEDFMQGVMEQVDQDLVACASSLHGSEAFRATTDELRTTVRLVVKALTSAAQHQRDISRFEFAANEDDFG
jgi:hypothetical protein